MKHNILWLGLLTALLIAGCSNSTGLHTSKSIVNNNDDVLIVTKYVTRNGSRLPKLLDELNFSSNVSKSIIKKFKKIEDPYRLKGQHTIIIRKKLNGDFVSLEYDKTIDSVYILVNTHDSIVITLKDQNITERDTFISGVIHKDIIKTMKTINQPKSLGYAIEKIFLGKYNFYKDLCDGDSFYLILRNKYLNDKYIGYDRIEYIKIDGKNIKTEVIYYSNSEYCGYFDNTGYSLEKNILIAPVPYNKITSDYGWRTHPLTHRREFHYGIDYAAPIKTPVYAAADGVIVKKMYRRRGLGREIVIDHGNGYKTVYAHLHRFARGIHVGSKVKYGQLIGYLGSSGLSTGPHLHFGVIYKNKVVNPDKLTIKSKYVINENEYASFISRYGYLTAMAEEYNSEKIKYTSVSKKEKFN